VLFGIFFCSFIWIATAFAQPTYPKNYAQSNFKCGFDGTTQVTLVKRGNKEVVLIRYPRTFSNEWITQQRCEQISNKFALNQFNGNLHHIVLGSTMGTMSYMLLNLQLGKSLIALTLKF
jgi:hypothetical protein